MRSAEGDIRDAVDDAESVAETVVEAGALAMSHEAGQVARNWCTGIRRERTSFLTWLDSAAIFGFGAGRW